MTELMDDIRKKNIIFAPMQKWNTYQHILSRPALVIVRCLPERNWDE